MERGERQRGPDRPGSLAAGWASHRVIQLVLLLVLLPSGSAGAQSSPRFAARFADGTRVEGGELSDWYNADLSPRLDGQPLLNPARPALWLLDRRLTPGPLPPSYVEMFSGDRLPGTVEDYVRPGPGAVVQQFDHWVVRPGISLHPPRQLEAARIRIDARFVRRIVWQPLGLAQYQPGTVFLRDGRRMAFRAVRIRSGVLSLLTAAGTELLAWSQVAELHLPAAEFWRLALAELAVLAPDGQTRLIQVETDEGLIATASLDRLTALPGGSESISDRWSHGLQPAWSLDVIWVPHSRIACRRMFAPHQFPLSRLPAVEERLGGQAAPWWTARTNRNVRGGLLRCGELDFGWGLGVHAPSRLRFPLPPLPTAFRGEFGLDRIARGGGCVQARVYVAAAENLHKLYESPPMIGDQPVLALGPLSLPAGGAESRELLLEVDAAHAQRPPAADPLFIRDLADWLDPVLEVDAAEWKQQIQQVLPGQVPAWSDWAVQTDGKLAWPSRLRESHVDFGSFLRCVEVQDEPLRLSRQVSLPAGRRWLLVAVSRGGTREARTGLAVRAGEQQIEPQDIPYRDSWHGESDPLLFELPDDVPAESTLELEVPPGSQVPLLWEGILLTQQLPMLRTLLEDDEPILPVGGVPPAANVARPRYSGTAAVAVPAGGACQRVFDAPLRIRERPRWGEFRFLRFAVLKSDGGRFALEIHHDREPSRPARYDGGQGPAGLPDAKRVWDDKLPQEWIVITRDLYADFGELDVHALTLSVPDGGGAIFDHLHAARSGSDFRHLPAPQPVQEP